MLLLKFYQFTQQLLQRFMILVQSLFNGFWLGILDFRALQRLDETYYSNENLYYSDAHNKRGLFKWEEEMIFEYFLACKNLLLIGAGAGREVFALRKMGFKVDAFECNQKLQEFGNKFLSEEGFEPCIKIVKRDFCPQTEKNYDGVIVGWATYMLIPGTSRRIEFLKQTRLQIKDGGRVLLSFFTRRDDGWRFKITFWVGDILRFLLNRENLRIGDSLASNYVHYFTHEEIKEELQCAGFKLLFYSDKGYGHAVGEKINEELLSYLPNLPKS